MSKLQALIGKLITANHASRDLDYAIADYLLREHGAALEHDLTDGRGSLLWLTSSVDAALKLVPKGWAGKLEWWRGNDGNEYARASLDPEDNPLSGMGADSTTMRSAALSICIAALSARLPR